MPTVLALVQDLMFLSRIREAARGSGLEVRGARDPARLLEACLAQLPALVLVDLDADRLKPLEAVSALRAEPSLAALAVVGFVSHVNDARARAAQKAGCTRVLTRGAFAQALPSLLAEAAR